MAQHMDLSKRIEETVLGDIQRGMPTAPDPTGYDELLEILGAHENGPPAVRGILHHRAVPEGTTWRQWDTRGRLWFWVSTSGIEKLKVDPKPRPVWPVEIYAYTGIDIYDMNDEEAVT